MSVKREFHSDCRGGNCGVGVYKSVPECGDGGGCFGAVLVGGFESEHHDKIMATATTAIQAVLDMIPEDPTGKGRNPAFIQTRRGLFLSWVRHGGKHEGEVITQQNPEEFEKALCLDVDTSEQSSY